MNTASLSLGLSLILLGSVSGCAGVALPPPQTAPSPQPFTLTGRILFGARLPTATGASAEQTMRPARQIEVHTVNAAGELMQALQTDDEGAFRVETTSDVRGLLLRAHIHADGLDLAVSRDALGRVTHELAVELPAGADTDPVEIALGDELEMAGALHLLDTVLLGARKVHEWSGEHVPPFYAYWGRGVTTEWSYYRGERVAGSGRYSVELMGGDPGRQSTSDTDEHDEAIILHEFGHFVMDVMSSDSSHGGTHPGGVLLDPGLAWEEGRASWFACAVLGAPVYVDTIGIQPQGSLRVAVNLETSTAQGPRGMGSEAGVEEILWDLSDGGDEGLAGHLPDTDNDGVALGAARVFAAMRAIAQEPGAFPGITSFLRHLVREGAADAIAVKRMLVQGGHPDSMLPVDDTPLWPIDVALGGVVSGKIDSLSDPTPSGGPPRPGNGRDAVQAFRVHVTRAGWLSLRLSVFGSGTPNDHSDVDLELRDLRSNILDASRGTGPSEEVQRLVEPGWYIVYVRDGGTPTRVGYELSVRVR